MSTLKAFEFFNLLMILSTKSGDTGSREKGMAPSCIIYLNVCRGCLLCGCILCLIVLFSLYLYNIHSAFQPFLRGLLPVQHPQKALWVRYMNSNLTNLEHSSRVFHGHHFPHNLLVFAAATQVFLFFLPLLDHFPVSYTGRSTLEVDLQQP